jgi:hypothetical protein
MMHGTYKVEVKKSLKMGVEPKSQKSYLPNNISDQFNSRHKFMTYIYVSLTKSSKANHLFLSAPL